MLYAGLLQCLTQIAQISRFCFVGGKSHRGSAQACSNASHRFNEIQQTFPLAQFINPQKKCANSWLIRKAMN